MVQDVTDGLTHAVRAGRTSTAALGVVWEQQAVVEISWPSWLAFPLALVVASTLLLASAVATTHRRRAPLWKSSVVSLVYHGIQQWDEDEKLGAGGGEVGEGRGDGGEGQVDERPPECISVGRDGPHQVILI